MSYKYPSDVVILAGKDFTCGIGHKTNCLIGWASVQFLGRPGTEVTTSDYYALPLRVKKALRAGITAVFGKQENPISAASSVYCVNDFGFDVLDDPKSSRAHKTKLARVWNLAMATLGYTEGNPEAKRGKK